MPARFQKNALGVSPIQGNFPVSDVSRRRCRRFHGLTHRLVARIRAELRVVTPSYRSLFWNVKRGNEFISMPGLL
jgi:hypothetical protein